MGTDIKLGKIFGIPIGINASWFIIFGLVTISLSTGYFPAQNPGFPLISNIILGVLASLLLFGSVLAHELGHAFVALRNQIPVRRINLFLLGGVAQIEEEPKSAGVEFKVAIAGPLVSLVLAIFFGVLSLLDQLSPAIATPSQYLARANFFLLAFNMLPGFPLDGGRVLRSAIWKFTGNPVKATNIASAAGQVIAYGMIGYGLYLAIMQANLLTGLWLGFIGWYLRNAAIASQRHVQIEQSLNGVTVGQVMSRNVYYVPNLISVQRIVDEFILAHGKKQFIVADINQVLGYLTASEIFQIPKHRWSFTTAEQAMTPIQYLNGVSPDAQITEALAKFSNSPVGSLPVLKDDRIVGALTQEDVNTFIRLRTQFST